MNVLSTILIAFSMSADAFAVAAAKGATLRHSRTSEALRIGAIFGAVEACTPVVGWGLGLAASSYITAFDHWIAFGILVALGINMIAGSFLPEKERKPACKPTLFALVMAALGSSIDAMGVGVTLAFIDANIWITAIAIGLATFLMATLGVSIGHSIGKKVGKIAEALGGGVLIAIGTIILCEHMALL